MKPTNQHDQQSVYTTSDTRITISMWLYGSMWYVRRVITSTDENYSRCLAWDMLYEGDYNAALTVYNQACAAHSFLPDNSSKESDEPVIVYDIEKDEIYYNSEESGQAILLFLMAVVCIAAVLYLCYTAISMLSGSEGGLFEVLINGLEEVIK